jgi:hypothetical protein
MALYVHRIFIGSVIPLQDGNSWVAKPTAVSMVPQVISTVIMARSRAEKTIRMVCGVFLKCLNM